MSLPFQPNQMEPFMVGGGGAPDASFLSKRTIPSYACTEFTVAVYSSGALVHATARGGVEDISHRDRRLHFSQAFTGLRESI
jgi:hypothetical protein